MSRVQKDEEEILDDYPLEELTVSSAEYVEDENTRYDEEEFTGLLPINGNSQTTASSHSRAGRAGRLRSLFLSLIAWAKGPKNPKSYKITPLFRLANIRWKSELMLVSTLLLGWILSSTLLIYGNGINPEIPGLGRPVKLTCTDSLWHNATDCGLNGEDCQPFNNSPMPFRCPAGCKNVQVLEPYAIGDHEVSYRSLVIGGFSANKNYSIYRGDSHICSAALQSGIINDRAGGCGVLNRIGEQDDFPHSNSNGISSVEFSSYFPLSFNLTRVDYNVATCPDVRWPLLFVAVVLTSALSFSTTSAPLFFFPIFVGIFFHVALASDPPSLTDKLELLSVAWGRFLPTVFIGVVIYYFCVRRTLQGLEARVEKTVLWLGGCWVGALHNYTFDRLPLSRLTPHDLKQQPGAITVLIVIVVAILAIALGQAWAFRKEGRLLTYLKLYGSFAILMIVLLVTPQMKLRIHHYILALILLPGTAMQTRPSLLYQGILIGLFINGIARWGYASILETPGQLLGDGQLGSILPQIASPTIGPNNITFSLPMIAEGFEGISVLVNDVERLRAHRSEDLHSLTWERHKEGMPEFFRFGNFARRFPRGIWYGDFTKAGTWKENGGWQPMESGPS